MRTLPIVLLAAGLLAGPAAAQDLKAGAIAVRDKALADSTGWDVVESLTTDSTPELDRFLGSESVDRDGLFGPGRHVPLPTYPWQTRRYWPGEEPAGDDPAEWLLGKHARTAFDQDSALVDIGIDSLAKLQLLVEVQQRTGREVDPEELAALRTVRDLCRWARDLAEVRR